MQDSMSVAHHMAVDPWRTGGQVRDRISGSVHTPSPYRLERKLYLGKLFTILRPGYC